MITKQELYNKISQLQLDYEILSVAVNSVTRKSSSSEYLESGVRTLDRKVNELDLRVKVIQDALETIARTLDANNIRTACSHCGQKLPKEQDCC